MDRVDQERPRQAALDEAHDGTRADDLGTVHVTVDDLGRPGHQLERQLVDRTVVVDLVDHVDRDAGSSPLAHGRAIREADDADVEPRAVDPGQQVEHALLCATVAAGRDQLEHADAFAAGRAMRREVMTARVLCWRERGRPIERRRHTGTVRWTRSR